MMETLEERADRLHREGKLPDRYYYQLVRKDPYEALQAQRQLEQDDAWSFIEMTLAGIVRGLIREILE